MVNFAHEPKPVFQHDPVAKRKWSRKQSVKLVSTVHVIFVPICRFYKIHPLNLIVVVSFVPFADQTHYLNPNCQD